MKRAGFDTRGSETPITPVMLGEVQLARHFSKPLYDEGVLALAKGYPLVPKGKARIRVMLSTSHKRGDLDEGLSVFVKIGRELGVIR
jgi:glycine C-acetyltransferase